ncbi:FAD-dependent monooxygenase [Agromyces aurantiacus]|uniref:FAD-dependent monooxygenase n=1 Tax=Agromyces aurantiacus TaxID=165814 RepID=A0ABV9QZ67_9MICO|nr:FAD-dependent monooxygenase [Agromyces aurantiacus]MBM7505486.1 2-polyprenyl-6-methoxyphenol hydroxylase-like FAD-dependent oxidoreductase [Agromyces aurantiacus]
MSIQTDTQPYDVVIAGAGPTGLLLAAELAAAGAGTLVLERAAHPDPTPKANGVVGRAAIELRRRGHLQGTGLRPVRPPRYGYGPFTLRLGVVGNPLHVLPVPQRRLEEMLEQGAVRHGATVLRAHRLDGFEQDAEGVTAHVTTADGRTEFRSGYLVGCDGAHSTVRRALGIEFEGTTSPTISRLARITIPDERIVRHRHELALPDGARLALFRPNVTEHGTITIAPARALDPAAPPDRYLVATQEPRGETTPTEDLDVSELRASLRRVLGTELPFTAAHAARSVVPNSRRAERYRSGRVFLAGDAAHVFSAGGSALNVGLLDAIALGETLAEALDRDGDEAVLDGYESRRRPAVDLALACTRVQHALETAGEEGDGLRRVAGELLTARRSARGIATLLEG